MPFWSTNDGQFAYIEDDGRWKGKQGEDQELTNHILAAAAATTREMGEDQQQRVVIVGGGIAGLATAVALHRVGVQSLVLESHHELRAAGAALTLAPNAWRALDVLGVASKLIPMYQAIEKGRVTNIDTGSIQEIFYNGANFSAKDYNGTKDRGLGLRSVHRKALLKALFEELPSGTVRFSSKLAFLKTEVLEDSSSIQVLHLEDGAVIRAKVLIGCDGVQSVVAQWLGLSIPVDSGRSAVRGIAVFPEGHGLKNVVQQYLATGKRAGVVPLDDKEVYWFITLGSGPQQRDPELIQREVIEKLAKDFPPEYLNVVRHSDLSSLTWAPLMYRRPWDIIFGHTHEGCVVVAGDAMHPMTPDLGQGGCSALEDAVVLGRSIGAARQKKIEDGVAEFVKERKWRVAGLIAGSYVTGWIQQGGTGISGRAIGWFRDHIFYKYVYPMIVNAVKYDCGELPIVKNE